MGAVVWKGAKSVEYKQMPRPLITDQTDVIVRITATTICGSDLHLYTNAMLDMHADDILGHEFMGIVEQVTSLMSISFQSDHLTLSKNTSVDSTHLTLC